MTGAKLRRTGLPAHTWCLNTKSNGRINRTVKGVGHECPTHTISSCFVRQAYNFTLRRRSAFVITDTELKLMAAAAKMGLSRSPKNG
jgi:hypothetical protein